MSESRYRPRVNETQEFIEIANDFSNPLDLVREAISNAFDHQASRIRIIFKIIHDHGEKALQITLEDNGIGIDENRMQAFFDLGNSSSRNNPEAIGEKGHGTKVYFNSSRIDLESRCNGTRLCAILEEPRKTLYDGDIPIVRWSATPDNGPSYTRIVITGYNNNRRNLFTHEILRDHILWFTKFGSIERQFGHDRYDGVELVLQGLNRSEPQTLTFGHVFPDPSPDIHVLFEEHLVDAPHLYCERVVRKGHLSTFPEIEYQAVFFIDGRWVKYQYNPMLRRRGYSAPEGAYLVQERYGLWLCKDFIPIQRKNEWITTKGSEYTKLHAFVNCQHLHLTANRGSADNTPAEYLQALEGEVRKLYEEIIAGDTWHDMRWLESEADAFRTERLEKAEFKRRTQKIKRAKVAEVGGYELVAPERESGVYALLLQLSILRPELFPFTMLDYDTHAGLDVLVKGDDTTPIHQSKLFYVELKYYLTKDFNHSFENLHSIVCWNTNMVKDDVVRDVGKKERKLAIAVPRAEGERTRYYLDDPRSAHRIEVYVLEVLLKEVLRLEFRPRSV